MTMIDYGSSFFIFLVNILLQLTRAQTELCPARSSTLLAYGRRCFNFRQCDTQYCYKGFCVCELSTVYDPCTSSCVPKCNSVLSGTSGHIMAPNYPRNIVIPNTCKWTISPKLRDAYIVFSLTDLDLCPTKECKTEYILIESSFKLFGPNCNMNDANTRTFASIGNSMNIILQQGYFNYRGFAGFFKAYEKKAIINSSYGIIASPGFPVKYPLNETYTWTIKGEHITLKIHYISLDTCCSELTIYYNSSGMSPIRVSNSSSNQTFVSNGNLMYIVFKTGGSGDYAGFNATFFIQGLSYGEECNKDVPGMCQEPDLVCNPDRYGNHRCLCNVNLNFNGYKCTDDIVKDIIVGTDFVSVYRINVSFLGHNITWNAPGEQAGRILYSINSTVLNISGLTPGERYTLQIFSQWPINRYEDTKMTTFIIEIITLPASPGPILTGQSDFRRSPYFIKFQRSPGVVQNYYISFVSEDSAVSYRIENPELSVIDLLPNTHYNYTITAFNKNSNRSQPFNGILFFNDENKDKNLIAIVTPVLAVLFVVTAFVGFMFYRKKRIQKQLKTQSVLPNLKSKIEGDEEQDLKTVKRYESLPGQDQFSRTRVSNPDSANGMSTDVLGGEDDLYINIAPMSLNSCHYETQ